MRFGNSTEHLWKGIIVGLMIGAAAYVFSAAMLIFYEGLPPDRLIPLTFILVVPALLIGLAIAPTLMFSVHIVGGWVEHRMLNRWVLSRARASDFTSMEAPSGFHAAVLRFADGTKIRFFGAEGEILASLESELQRRTNTVEQAHGDQPLTRSEFE